MGGLEARRCRTAHKAAAGARPFSRIHEAEARCQTQQRGYRAERAQAAAWLRREVLHTEVARRGEDALVADAHHGADWRLERPTSSLLVTRDALSREPQCRVTPHARPVPLLCDSDVNNRAS